MAHSKELVPLAGKLLLASSGAKVIHEVIEASLPNEVVSNVAVIAGGLVIASCVVSAAAEKLIEEKQG